MKIRRYIGNNTQEAILKVKMDLGNEALILNTRRVRKKGLLSFLSKPLTEVLAAVDDDYGVKTVKETQKKPEVTEEEQDKTQVKNKFVEKEEKIINLENKVSSMEMLLSKIYEKIQTHDPIPQKEESKYTEMVLKQEDKLQKVNFDTEPPVENKSKEEDSSDVRCRDILNTFCTNLRKNEVDEEIVKEIMEKVAQKLDKSNSIDEMISSLYNVITGMLGKPETIKLREDGKPTILLFVGPTGVGKTTTLAKIAASYALNDKKNIGLITADTYRIAAVEQLKTYAEIMGMPVTVVYSPAEIKDAIDSYADKDIILIDTPGRSHRSKQQFEELRTLIEMCEADDIYLLLSATTSYRNCRDIVNTYSFLKDYKIIFTKVDETQLNGVILNIRCFTGKKLSYITTGQSVPDDIEMINADKFTKKLLGSIT